MRTRETPKKERRRRKNVLQAVEWSKLEKGREIEVTNSSVWQ